MDADGRNSLRIVANPAFDVFPSLSPDGARVTWISNREGNYDIFAQNIDGTGLEQLTATEDFDEGHTPRFSPDGTRLLFARVPADEGEMGNTDVIVLDLESGAELNLTEDHLGRDGEAAWSPDGASIVFVSDRAGSDDVYITPSDHADPVALTTEPTVDQWPSLAPGGDLLVYTAQREDDDGGAVELRVATIGKTDADFGRVSSVSTLVEMPAVVAPTWSLDGESVAFQAQSPDGSTNIYIVEVDGGEPLALTRTVFASRHPEWGVAFEIPPVVGDVVLTATVEGSKESEFAGTKFPFSWTHDVALTNVEYTRLLAGDDDPQLVHKVMSAFVEPTDDGVIEGTPTFEVSGQSVTGSVIVSSKNGGEQGTLRIEATVEGTITSTSLELVATESTITSTWDFGEGPIDLPTELEKFELRRVPRR